MAPTLQSSSTLAHGAAAHNLRGSDSAALLAAGSSLAQLLAAPIHTARLWWQRHVERDALVAMDERLLRDMGMTRSDALREWRKAFWEA